MTDSKGNNGADTPDFRYAPSGWSKLSAESEASAAGLTPAAEHWEAVNALQEFFSRHDEPRINARELRDALEEIDAKKPVKVLICGSLYLAGQILGDNDLIPD